MNTQNQIIIHSNKLEERDNSCRLVTKIEENGRLYDLFFEVEKQYSPYLVTETADAILYLVLMYALRENISIVSNVPITTQFFHNIKEVLIPSLLSGDRSLHNIDIEAPLIDVNFEGKGIGASVTCGVDSFYTIKKYFDSDYKSMNITHLFISSCSIDLWKSNVETVEDFKKKFNVLFERYNGVANELQLPLVTAYSNYMEFLCSGRQRINRHVTVHHYITMANILCLRKLWKTYYFSSSEPFSIFNLRGNSNQPTSRHELLSMHVLTIPGFNCYSSGANATREQKTIELADFPVATRYLRPCFKLLPKKNCSKPTCPKCLRALLALDVYDKLDAFAPVFDVEKYKKYRKQYLVRAFANRKNEYIGPLLLKLREKYPSLVEEAELSADMPKQWEEFRNKLQSKIPAKLNFSTKNTQYYYKIFIEGISKKIHFEVINSDVIYFGIHCEDKSLQPYCKNEFLNIKKIWNINYPLESDYKINIEIEPENVESEIPSHIHKIWDIVESLRSNSKLSTVTKQ